MSLQMYHTSPNNAPIVAVMYRMSIQGPSFSDGSPKKNELSVDCTLSNPPTTVRNAAPTGAKIKLAPRRGTKKERTKTMSKATKMNFIIDLFKTTRKGPMFLKPIKGPTSAFIYCRASCWSTKQPRHHHRNRSRACLHLLPNALHCWAIPRLHRCGGLVSPFND